MKLAAAKDLAWNVRKELAPFCDRIEIAGSIRRERPEVNDVDLVLIPKSPVDQQALLARCLRTCTQVNARAKQNFIFRMSNVFQLDIWVAHGEIVDLVSKKPGNWGAVLLCRTGSIAHNVQLCNLAISKGLKFAPYRGVVKGEDIIASEREEDIYHALGLTYRDPAEREQLS